VHQVVALAHRQQSPLAAIMLDIDHFKRVNDVHGHHVGDQVIRAVVGRLARGARTTDIFGRYGGEEFALILPDTGTEGVLLRRDAPPIAVVAPNDHAAVGVLQVTSERPH